MKKFQFLRIHNTKNITSVWDALEEASYILNRDFTMTARTQSSIGIVKFPFLSNGSNLLETENKKILEIVVTQHHTLLAGTCYEIKSNISIPPPLSVSIHLIANKSGNKEDSLQVL